MTFDDSEKLSGQYRTRVRRKRIILLTVAIGFVLFRILSCHEKTTVCGPSTLLPSDDYNRYNNRIFTCIRVVDGDTVDINVPDPNSRRPRAHTRIRLWGIDTPELPHGGRKEMYFAQQATEFARKLLAGKPIRLELIDGKTRGYYGRLLAYIWLPDGRLFNRLVIEQGYGYADYRFRHPRRKEFLGLEKKAREELKGLWKNVTPDDLPHWYRASKLKYFWEMRKLKNHRKTRSGSSASRWPSYFFFHGGVDGRYALNSSISFSSYAPAYSSFRNFSIPSSRNRFHESSSCPGLMG